MAFSWNGSELKFDLCSINYRFISCFIIIFAFTFTIAFAFKSKFKCFVSQQRALHHACMLNSKVGHFYLRVCAASSFAFTCAFTFQDIGNDLGAGNELASYSAHVRSYESYLYGVDRNNIHYVPYYTKSHISNMLANYHERLAIYKDNLDRMESSKESQEEVLKVIHRIIPRG